MNEPLNDKSISETLNVIRKALQEDSVDNIELIFIKFRK